jgi:hypothetical protein
MNKDATTLVEYKAISCGVSLPKLLKGKSKISR